LRKFVDPYSGDNITLSDAISIDPKALEKFNDLLTKYQATAAEALEVKLTPAGTLTDLARAVTSFGPPSSAAPTVALKMPGLVGGFSQIGEFLRNMNPYRMLTAQGPAFAQAIPAAMSAGGVNASAAVATGALASNINMFNMGSGSGFTFDLQLIFANNDLTKIKDAFKDLSGSANISFRDGNTKELVVTSVPGGNFNFRVVDRAQGSMINGTYKHKVLASGENVSLDDISQAFITHRNGSSFSIRGMIY
jgi:hypothetical protein